jgi:hypothetical protein
MCKQHAGEGEFDFQELSVTDHLPDIDREELAAGR